MMFDPPNYSPMHPSLFCNGQPFGYIVNISFLEKNVIFFYQKILPYFVELLKHVILNEQNPTSATFPFLKTPNKGRKIMRDDYFPQRSASFSEEKYLVLRFDVSRFLNVDVIAVELFCSVAFTE